MFITTKLIYFVLVWNLWNVLFSTFKKHSGMYISPSHTCWIYFLFMFLHLPSPPPYFPSHHPSSGLSLCWNHTGAFHTSRHTGETYAGWNMVRELCWISLAKRVVINRMTYGNNYQPSSLHPSFPPSFSSLTHPSLCPSASPTHSVIAFWWG